MSRSTTSGRIGRPPRRRQSRTAEQQLCRKRLRREVAVPRDLCDGSLSARKPAASRGGRHTVCRQRGPAAAERPAFNALLTAVDMAEIGRADETAGRPIEAMPAYGRNATVRQAFEVAFGYDPSDPRETVTSSIPQALAMMNGVRINLAVPRVDRETVLGRLLEGHTGLTKT